MPDAASKQGRVEILLSPFLVIAVGYTTARIAGHFLGVWAWVPLALVFWGTLALITSRYERGADWRARLRAPRGAQRWAALAVLIGLLPLPLFLLNWKQVLPATIFLPWLVFGLVNPWFEEGYWRGLLLDATDGWPAALRVGYTAAVFAASHPLMFGVNSVGVRSPEVLVSTFVMGAAWAAIYLKTHSLRWCIASHAVVDLLSVSVPVFLNRVVPPQGG